jgi:ribosomal protein S18 acetylase RimI-like enzyme
MKLHYAHLSRWHYPQIFNTFVEAFADHAVSMSYLTRESLLSRWTKNAVDFKASVGAFDGERLVGFTMIGIDDWMGSPAAFDAGTGIVKGYRGFGVAPEMFELAVEGLRVRGIPTLMLEVIQTNRPAVRTYRKLGFKVTREFDCLRLPRERAHAKCGRAGNGAAVEAVGKDLLPVFERFADWRPSWETGFRAIARVPDQVRLYGARSDGAWVGFAAYHPALHWLMNVSVRPSHRRHGIATALLQRVVANLPPDVEALKLINVERSDTGMLSWAGEMGFESYARQFEMALMIPGGRQR